MYIEVTSLQELATVCAALVREGVTFKASTATLVITLLGGY